MFKTQKGGENLIATVKKSNILSISVILLALAAIFALGINDVSAHDVNISSNSTLSANLTTNDSVQSADLKTDQNQSKTNATKNQSTTKSNTTTSKTTKSSNTLPDPQIYNNGVPVARGVHPAGYVYPTIAAAIADAQAGDTIMLQSGSVFYERITVTKSLTFDVLNGGHATIDGSSGGRIVTINSGLTVTFNNINFAHGVVTGTNSGGAILNPGILILNNCTFSSNTANDAGAISNSGTLTINNCTFTGNTATGTGNNNGGAISNSGTLKVVDSTFTNNVASTSGNYGGAIYNTGSLNVAGSTFTGNSASYGGAIYSTSTLSVTGSTFSSNSATTYGGAIYSTSTLSVTGSTFSSNSASYGGAIYTTGGTSTAPVNITGSAFTGNVASTYGGAVYNTGILTVANSNFTNNNATTTTTGAYAQGGAIFSSNTITITGSTFTGNAANARTATYAGGGAISYGAGGSQPSGTMTITGSTFTNNSGNYGGVIWNYGTLNIDSSTFTGNKGVEGGAIRTWGALTITSSTFTGNTASTSGDAISNYQGTTTAHFNRIVGNGDNDIDCVSGSVNAENNWWGSNTGPTAARITGTVDGNPWIILKISASPTSILVGGTSTVTADLTWNSNNAQPTGGHVPDGTPITFSGTLGTIPNASTVNGIATTTFTAGNTPGTATVSALLDGVTVSTSITLRPVANLGINQNVNTPVNVGDTVTYTVTVKNNGPNTANNIKIQDVLPSGFTVTSYSSGTTYSNGIWTITSLTSGSTVTLTISGTATASMAGLNTTNTVTELSQTEYTSQLPTNTTAVYTKKASVALTQTTSSTPVNVGDTVTYTVTATNKGPDTATNINIQDIIPSGLTDYVVTPSAGTTYSNGVWTISSLAANGIATLTIAGKAGASMAGLTTVNTATRISQTEYNDQSATSTSSGIYVKKASVVISNTASSSNLNVGQTGKFTVTVTNTGPDAATNIVINDPAPSGFTASVTGGTYSNGVWTISSLAANSAVTLTFTGTITAAMAGTNITNHATETQTEYPPSTISDATIHVNKANVTITNSANSSNLNVGQTGTFTVTVTNTGPDAATNIVINDPAPSGFTASVTGGTYSNGVWTISNLASNSAVTLTFTGTITAAMVGLNITNTATETQTEYPFNVTISNATMHVNKANVVVTVTSSNNRPNVGQSYTYTVTVKNNGDDSATGVIVAGSLPAGLTLNGYSASQGTFINGQWNIGTLASGNTATLTITVTPQSSVAGQDVTVTATETQNEYPPTSSATSTVHVPKANVVISNTASSGNLNVGQTGTFTVKVTNNGPDAANIVINDPTPSGFTASVTGGTYSNGVWTITNLGSGEFVTLTFTGQITAAMAGLNITNTATETQTEYPFTVSISDAKIHVNKADVSISKTVNGVSRAVVNVGDTITYLITVTNKGIDSATGLQITDLVPSGLSNLGYTVSTGTYSLATGLWNIGTLENGATATLTITGKITAAMAGLTITNQAAITAENEYSSLPVVSAADVYTKLAEVQINQTATPKANVGDTVTYKVYVKNNGPDTATNITLSDIPPSVLSNVHITPSAGTTYSSGVWTIASLANGETAVLTITGTATAPMAGKTINNTAVLTGETEYDPSTIGDSTTAGVYTNEANVVISNTPNSNSLNVGDTGKFTVTVTNDGPDTATNIKINDILPGGFTASTTGGSYDGSVWTIDSLESGKSVTLTFTGAITAAMAGLNITNTATETQTEYPFNVDISNATIHVKKADVALSQNSGYSGNKVTFVVKATNNGPDAVTNINIKDLIPTGLTGASITVSAGNYNSATGVWTISSLDSGAFATLIITGNATPQAIVKNNATWLNQTEYNSQPNNSTVKVYVPSVDIAVYNGPWLCDSSVGNVVNYRCANTPVMIAEVDNYGPDDATGVVVQYTLGAGLIYIGCNTQGVGSTSYDPSTRTITWYIGNMPNNGAVYMKIYLYVNQTGIFTSNLNTTAKLVHVDQYDSDGTDDEQSCPLSVPTSADIQVNQSYTTYTQNGAQYVTYTITVTNNGPDNASGIKITDKLPTGLQYASSSAPAGTTYTSSTGVWTIGTLNNGTTLILTITAKITGTGTIKNRAYLSAKAQDDWNYNNNEQTTIINHSTYVPSVDIAVYNGPWLCDSSVGNVVNYRCANTPVMIAEVDNYGPDDATGVVVQYTLGAGLIYIGCNTQGVGSTSYDPSTRTITWYIGNMPNNGAVYMKIYLYVNQTGIFTSNLNTTAKLVHVDQYDSDGTDDEQSCPLSVPTSADIQVNQSYTTYTQNGAQYVTYTITVTNNGPDNASGIKITDKLPTGLQYASSSAPAGTTYTSSTGVWTIGTLNNGTTLILTITAKITGTGTIKNRAYLSAKAQDDWNYNNNEQTTYIIMT